MPLKLQKVPAGLVAALDLKTVGRNPDLFSEMVSGVIELLDFYVANDRFRNGTQVGSVGAAPTEVNSLMDDGPNRLMAVDGQLLLQSAGAASAYYIGAFQLILPGGTTPVRLANAVIQAPAAGFDAGTLISCATALPHPLVVPSGTTLRSSWQSNDPAVDLLPLLSFSIQSLV